MTFAECLDGVGTRTPPLRRWCCHYHNAVAWLLCYLASQTTNLPVGISITEQLETAGSIPQVSKITRSYYDLVWGYPNDSMMATTHYSTASAATGCHNQFSAVILPR